VQHAVDRFGGRGAQQRIDAATAARNAAAAAVEQHVLFVGLRSASVRWRCARYAARREAIMPLSWLLSEKPISTVCSRPRAFQVTLVDAVLEQLAHDCTAALQRLDRSNCGATSSATSPLLLS
jgi:hypothetical protein